MSKTVEKLDQFKKGFRGAKKAIPGTMKIWGEWHNAVMAAGALDAKTKETIALGMALVLRCPGCIALHVQACKKLGVTVPEIWDIFEVAMLMGGGPAMTYCAELEDAIGEFYPPETKEAEKPKE
jgi:AhpD family alkylhydroperoxidase